MNCAPASILRRVLLELESEVRRARIAGGTEKELGEPFSSSPAMSRPSRRPRAAASISSVVRSNTPFACRMIAVRVVPGHEQELADAEQRGAEQIRLDGDRLRSAPSPDRSARPRA